MNKASRFLVVVIAALGAALAMTSAAVAQIVVGQVAPGTNPVALCEFTKPYDEFQTAVSSGPSYSVPASGVLTSWSTNAAAGGGQALSLKVFRPAGPNTYSVVAHDGPRALAPSVLNTFPASIPVLAGDIVGLATPAGNPGVGGVPTACNFPTANLSDLIGYHEQFAPDGGTVVPEEFLEGGRVNVSATVLQPPTISAIAPAKGSVTGGTSVVLTGANFASVSAVSFGTTAAKSFAVNSEGQITAVAPASKTLSKVPVSVTTVAGVASSVQTFAYEGCKVPKLSGKKLKAAKRGLRKSGCKLGKVRITGDATAKTGKVTKQNPKPGKVLAPGSKVGVKLG